MAEQATKHYGNELSLLDATYRTTKYALPLFFLVVKTNIDYQIVGSFVLQSEASPEIERVLRVIAGWNDGWSPTNFMVDYSEAEIQAVGRLFPGKTDMKDFILKLFAYMHLCRRLGEGCSRSAHFSIAHDVPPLGINLHQGWGVRSVIEIEVVL